MLVNVICNGSCNELGNMVIVICNGSFNEFFYVTGFGNCEHCNAFGSFMQLGNCNEICKYI